MSHKVRIALGAAEQVGYFAAKLDELERKLAILEHPSAEARPTAAWDALPYGWSAESTIDYLDQLPVEREPDLYLHYSRINHQLRHLKVAERNQEAYLQIQTQANEVTCVH